MEIPKEFEDIFRGVDLTEDEIRTLHWLVGWERRTVENLRSAIRKAQATALSALQAENEKLRAEVESLKKEHCAGCSVPVVEAERLRDLNEAPKLRAELEQVKRENDALWTYIEIVDRVYRRYMDRGYIDRLDELKKVWKNGQKED